MDRIQEISEALNRLDENSDSDELATLIGKIETLADAVDKLIEAKKSLLFAWLQKNNSLTIGPVRYYIGNKTSVKCIDQKEAFKRLLELFGLDVENFLASGAWKHGSIRKALEEVHAIEVFDQLFTTEIKHDIATGKPVKEVKSIDTTFVKSK